MQWYYFWDRKRTTLFKLQFKKESKNDWLSFESLRDSFCPFGRDSSVDDCTEKREEFKCDLKIIHALKISDLKTIFFLHALMTSVTAIPSKNFNAFMLTAVCEVCTGKTNLISHTSLSFDVFICKKWKFYLFDLILYDAFNYNLVRMCCISIRIYHTWC